MVSKLHFKLSCVASLFLSIWGQQMKRRDGQIVFGAALKSKVVFDKRASGGG